MFASSNDLDSDKELLDADSLINAVGVKDYTRHFRNHMMNDAVGKIQEMWVENGDAFAVSLISKSRAGEDLYIKYKEGIINAHSFGMIGMNYHLIAGSDVTLVSNFKIVEVSSLDNWGSNLRAKTLEVKSIKTVADLLRVKDTTNISLKSLLERYDETNKDLEKIILRLDKNSY